MSFWRNLFVLALCAFSLEVMAYDCCLLPFLGEVRIRHLEPKGLGYTKGYSSLDLQVMAHNQLCGFTPVLDLRGHIFNDGKLAANAGVGLRFLSEPLEEIFGVNVFYDSRHTSKKHYNQISLGFEALSLQWDFRVNAYLVLGSKRSSAYDFDFNLATFLLTAKREYPMNGFSAEVGHHFPTLRCLDTYAAFGPYYYFSKESGRDAAGGLLRLALTFCSYLSLDGIVSYDPVFNWIGQGAISLNFTFDSNESLCILPCTLQQRLYQPIRHNEIIVVQKRRRKLS